ncbi:MAG: hypothetical protein JETCAE01_25550 [Anaerolineaceae bacterium]|nr:MAG: hypothetical protein JETCAE01_25550 [Anaerolineaceae bacterium]
MSEDETNMTITYDCGCTYEVMLSVAHIVLGVRIEYFCDLHDPRRKWRVKIDPLRLPQ